MKLKTFYLPSEFTINEYSITDIQAMQKALKDSFKEFKRNYIDLNIEYRKSTIRNFRKFCIIEYIRYLDCIYLDKCEGYEECTHPSIVRKELLKFLHSIIPKEIDEITMKALRRSLEYLENHHYITTQERNYSFENYDRTVDSYTCIEDDTMLSLKFLSKKYVADLFETKEFCLAITTKKDEDIEAFINAILEDYQDDIIDITYFESDLKPNGYNQPVSYLKVICKKSSKIYDDFTKKRKENLSHGIKKNQ